MPSGRLPRIVPIALSTSITASLTSVPISNSTVVFELPSLAEEVMVFTPLIERTADSTSCVIWFSISVGAAPGCEMETLTAGNSTSGLLTTSMRLKLSNPASSRAVKITIGMTGLRIDHADILLKSITDLPVSGRTTQPLVNIEDGIEEGRRVDTGPLQGIATCATVNGSAHCVSAATGLIVSPGVRKPPARSTMRSLPVRPSVTVTPSAVTRPRVIARRSTVLFSPTI